MSTTTSTNMLLPVPVVGVEPGPAWATDINNCLTIIDQHDHSSGSGVPITPSGLNINSNLTMNDNNLIAILSARFQSQSAALSGASDLGCLYEVGDDLYYNDGVGNQIRITQSGAVAGTPGSISSLVSPASASYNVGSSTFIFQSDANTPAYIDGASILIRNLTANSKALTLAPPNAMGSDYTITLPALPAAQNIMTIDASGNITAAWNVDTTTIEVASNLLRVKDSGISTAKIADSAVTSAKIASATIVTGNIASATILGANIAAQTLTQGLRAVMAVGTSVAAGGIAISASCGSFSVTSNSFADVTNLSVTIVTTGRPVYVGLIGDTAGAGSFTTTGNRLDMQFVRDGSSIATFVQVYSNNQVGGTPLVATPCGSAWTVDITPTAGSHTYKFQAARDVPTSFINNARLIAYEI